METYDLTLSLLEFFLRGFQLALPWAPSTNELWITTKFGRRIISPKYREFKKLSKDYYFRQNCPVLPPIPANYVLTEHITEFPPNTNWYSSRMKNGTQTWDVGNREKAVNDALTDLGFWVDDRLIRRIIIEEGELYGDGIILVEFKVDKVDRRRFESTLPYIRRDIYKE